MVCECEQESPLFVKEYGCVVSCLEREPYAILLLCLALLQWQSCCLSGNRPSCSCTCVPEWTGTSCQTSNVCTSANDCSGNAASVSGNRPSCTCTCPAEWIGAKCEVSNVCTSAADCNGRAARVTGNRPQCTCRCLAAYDGTACAVTRTITFSRSPHSQHHNAWTECHPLHHARRCRARKQGRGLLLKVKSVPVLIFAASNTTLGSSSFTGTSQSASNTTRRPTAAAPPTPSPRSTPAGSAPFIVATAPQQQQQRGPRARGSCWIVRVTRAGCCGQQQTWQQYRHDIRSPACHHSRRGV
jgi:hypothetical protein